MTTRTMPPFETYQFEQRSLDGTWKLSIPSPTLPLKNIKTPNWYYFSSNKNHREKATTHKTNNNSIRPSKPVTKPPNQTSQPNLPTRSSSQNLPTRSFNWKSTIQHIIYLISTSTHCPGPAQSNHHCTTQEYISSGQKSQIEQTAINDNIIVGLSGAVWS